jgi:hypothetical protein
MEIVNETQVNQVPAIKQQPAWIARWGKRAGVIAFLFFFIKGLAWLVVPVALATWWAQ